MGAADEFSRGAVSDGASHPRRFDEVARILSRLERERHAKVLTSPGRIIAFGFVLPLVAVLLESSAGICQRAVFDPLPSAWHVLVGAVGIALCVIVPCLTRSRASTPRVSTSLNAAAGFALAVTTLYAFLFLPLLPLSLVGIVFMGIGILGLAPFTLFGSLIVVLKRLPPAPRGKLVPATGFALGAIVLALLEAPPIARWEAIMTKDVATVRALVNERELARICQNLSDSRGVLSSRNAGGLFESDAERWRRSEFWGTRHGLYYRVTGEPLENINLIGERPEREPWSSGAEWVGDAEADVFQATARVGHVIPGLGLVSSAFVGRIENDAAVGTLSWTLEFRNDHERLPREARARVRLPEGAVVTGVTAWMKGEPREAAYGAIARVESAYKSVVPEGQRRVVWRDPLLVLHDGPDRVRIQCYPVPEKGGTMKIRLKITAPCKLDAEGNARLSLPRLLEANFDAPGAFTHDVTLKGDRAIEVENARFKKTIEGGLQVASGKLSRAKVDSGSVAIRVERDPSVGLAWHRDGVDGEFPVVIQRIEPRPVPAPRHVAVVLDTSAAMAPYLDEIARAFESAPADIRFSLIVAGDSVEEHRATNDARASSGRFLASTISKLEAIGGRDNARALRRAGALDDDPADTILWIHAGQPVFLPELDAELFEPVRGWPPASERAPKLALDHGARVIEYQVTGGRSVVLEALEKGSRVESLSVTGSPLADLSRLLATWASGAEAPLVATRERAQVPPTGNDDAVEASVALSKLEAWDLVRESWREDPGLATRVALARRLVTPVSGAVVLETDEEYDEHGLKRPPESAPDAFGPALPEPEEIALIAVAALVLAGALAREILRRRRALLTT